MKKILTSIFGVDMLKRNETKRNETKRNETNILTQKNGEEVLLFSASSFGVLNPLGGGLC